MIGCVVCSYFIVCCFSIQMWGGGAVLCRVALGVGFSTCL